MKPPRRSSPGLRRPLLSFVVRRWAPRRLASKRSRHPNHGQAERRPGGAIAWEVDERGADGEFVIDAAMEADEVDDMETLGRLRSTRPRGGKPRLTPYSKRAKADERLLQMSGRQEEVVRGGGGDNRGKVGAERELLDRRPGASAAKGGSADADAPSPPTPTTRTTRERRGDAAAARPDWTPILTRRRGPDAFSDRRLSPDIISSYGSTRRQGQRLPEMTVHHRGGDGTPPPSAARGTNP